MSPSISACGRKVIDSFRLTLALGLKPSCLLADLSDKSFGSVVVNIRATSLKKCWLSASGECGLGVAGHRFHDVRRERQVPTGGVVDVALANPATNTHVPTTDRQRAKECLRRTGIRPGTSSKYFAFSYHFLPVVEYDSMGKSQKEAQSPANSSPQLSGVVQQIFRLIVK